METFLNTVKIPKMIEVSQIFESRAISNVEDELNKNLQESQVKELIYSGMKIGITAGSRGISNISLITRKVGDFIRRNGGEPFIIPSMGSHGGATAEGQKDLLKEYGITEETMGMPIISSMEVVIVDKLSDGTPIYLDKNAYNADGIVLINRIKAHTGFRGNYESGLVKMLTVGLGKQAGAEVCHSKGLSYIGEYINKAGKIVLNKVNIIFGLAILENAYEETSGLVVLKKDEILNEEPRLLQKSKKDMACIKLEDLDILIIDKIGKNFSGAGMDPNITRKFINPDIDSIPIAKKIVVLGLSEETHGNANGIGLADITTNRVKEQIDFNSMYMNSLTSGVTESSKIPMFFKSDKLSIQAAIKLTEKNDPKDLKIIRIPNTLDLKQMFISEGLVEQAEGRKDIIIKGYLSNMAFNEKDNLF